MAAVKLLKSAIRIFLIVFTVVMLPLVHFLFGLVGDLCALTFILLVAIAK